MNQLERALEVFLTHATTGNVLIAGSEPPRLRVEHSNCSVLELGPGDSICTAVIAKSLGATKPWLIDAGDFATGETTAYVALGKILLSRGYAHAAVAVAGGVEDALRICNGS